MIRPSTPNPLDAHDLSCPSLHMVLCIRPEIVIVVLSISSHVSTMLPTSLTLTGTSKTTPFHVTFDHAQIRPG